jgi:hypothetical protein
MVAAVPSAAGGPRPVVVWGGAARSGRPGVDTRKGRGLHERLARGNGRHACHHSDGQEEGEGPAGGAPKSRH